MNIQPASQQSIIQIKSNDIIQLILQYLLQNKFVNTFKAFQQQSNVTLNQINQRQFVNAFKSNNWSYIITQLSSLMLSQQLFFLVYEYICDSLIQTDKFQAAQYIVQQVILPNIKEMALFRQKIMRLQYIIEHKDQKNLYKNPPSQSRQSNIINQLLTVSTEAEPQRLLKLLTQSLKYQVSEGVINPSIKLNLFTGVQDKFQPQSQSLIKQVEKTISYTQESKITQLKLSWNEQYLAVGGIDGLIQLYNTIDYTLYDNEYQRQGQMFFHDYPIQLMQFNHTDEMLASVDSKGLINIWNLKNGKLLRKIDKQTNVNALCWGTDPSHLVVGYKQNIKLYGIRSCNVLKQYKCNGSQFIQSLFPSQNHLFCISNIGTITVFNYSTSQMLSNLQSKQKISNCFRLFKDNITWVFQKIVIAYANKIVEYDQYIMQGKSYVMQDGQIQNCIAVGQYLYVCIKGSDNKCRLSIIERSKKKVIYYTGLQSEFEHMLMLRKRNLLITYGQDHKLCFWRP